MAAFCTCCGGAITAKSQICPACGAPAHGMRGSIASWTDAEPVPTDSGAAMDGADIAAVGEKIKGVGNVEQKAGTGRARCCVV